MLSPDLSPREQDVAYLVAQGLTNQEIADKLGIAPGTVAQHLWNVYRWLGLRGGCQRVRLARAVWEQERGRTR